MSASAFTQRCFLGFVFDSVEEIPTNLEDFDAYEDDEGDKIYVGIDLTEGLEHIEGTGVCQGSVSLDDFMKFVDSLPEVSGQKPLIHFFWDFL